MKMLLDQLFIVIRAVIFKEKGSNRVWNERLDDFQRRVFLYFLINITFNFQPCLLEQTGPQIDGFDRLGKERHFLIAKDIVIDVDVFFSAVYIHMNNMNSIGTWLS